MDELKRMLERRAQEMRLDEDLPAEIRTRARRRRLGTAVLSLTVVAAIGASSFIAVHELMERRSRLGPQPATSPTSGLRPVWPSIEEILRIQDMVTRDHATWALTPKGVGQVFAERVMRWNPVDVEIVPRNELPAHDALLDRREFLPIKNERLAEETGLSEAPITWLHLYELPGDPPVYMVTRITSDAIELDSPVPTVVPTDQADVPFSARITVDPRTVEVAFALHPRRLEVSPSDSIFQSQTGQLVEDALISIGNTRIASATITDLNRAPLAMTAIAFESAPAIQIAELHDESAPVPGPTPTSTRDTPSAVDIAVVNATGMEAAFDYLRQLVSTEGQGPMHGGYRIAFGTLDRENLQAGTILHCERASGVEAERLRERFFPGAEIRFHSSVDYAIRIELGQDFLQREGDRIDAFSEARKFMWARQDGQGTQARDHLSPGATAQYDNREGGLDLLAYTEGASLDITRLERTGEGSVQVVYRIVDLEDGGPDRYETLWLEPRPGAPRQYWVVSAERNA